MRILFILVRVLGALAVVAAVVAQFISNVQFRDTLAHPNVAGATVNFFSFFTIDSNLLTIVSFAIGAVFLIQGRASDPSRYATFRASVAAYMATTGIVYNLLLRGAVTLDGLIVPWSNEILHVVAPLLVVIDWLFAPGRISVDWKKIGVIVIFPIVWAVYTMIRAPFASDDITGNPYWYPYPFLNPNIAPEGYVSVAFYIVLIAAIIGGVGAAIIWVSRRGRWPLKG